MASIFDLLMDAYKNSVGQMFHGQESQVGIYVRPVGNYAGDLNHIWTPSNTVITNPWGVTAGFGGGGRLGGGLGLPTTYLAPGQSYDTASNRYNDPTMHASTAARLNTAVQARSVNEAGLSASGTTSARSAPSVLSTLDQLYWGNVNTEVSTSTALTNKQQANVTGINTAGTRTILGAEAAKPVKTTTTALKRALT